MFWVLGYLVVLSCLMWMNYRFFEMIGKDDDQNDLNSK